MAFLIQLDDCGGDFREGAITISQLDFGSRTRAFAGTHHGPPIVRGILRNEQHFEFTACARVHSVKASRDDFGIVQNQQITGAEKLREMRKTFVCHRSRWCALERV